jgi:dTDP-4-dehydrorhamnose reductase
MILVFGAGFLGKRLAASLNAKLVNDIDISQNLVGNVLERYRPTAVINAAGKTGRPNVDWCEQHPFETMQSNTIGPIALAEACAERNAYLVHLASGCIFYGPSPSPNGWREDDCANPSAFYSRSKYAADLVLSQLANVAIVRLRMPIDTLPGPRNLITKLAGYEYVVDVENSVTIVPDLIDVVDGLIKRRATGIFHAVNPGPVRHAFLLEMYRQFVDPNHCATLIREEELVSRGLTVRARSNCVLASSRLEAIGLSMRSTETALPDVFRQYAEVFHGR